MGPKRNRGECLLKKNIRKGVSSFDKKKKEKKEKYDEIREKEREIEREKEVRYLVMMRCNNRNKSRKVTPRSSQFGESSCSFETQWRTERSAGRPRSQAGFSNRLNQSRLLFCPTCLFSSLPLFLIPSPSHHRSSPLVRGVIGRKNVGLATSLVSLHFPAPNTRQFFTNYYTTGHGSFSFFLSLSDIHLTLSRNRRIG